MDFSALFLSISRLNKVVDPRVLDLAGGAVAMVRVPNGSHQKVLRSLEKAIISWLKRESLPTLDELVETGKLASGEYFTHGGPFCAKDIEESNRQFFQGKQLTSTPILQAELKSKDSSNLILEVQVHPENYISDSTAAELTRNPGLFMVGRLTDVAPPNLKAQAYAIGFIHDQPTWQDDTMDQKPIDPIQLSEKQKADYDKHKYLCRDRVFILGERPMNRNNFIEVNCKKIKTGESPFMLFLRFVVELKKNEGGWINTITLQKEDLITDTQAYQAYKRLRDKLERDLLKKDAKKFIQNDESKNYRISTHPDFITYDKNKLLEHEDSQIRELAKKLP